MGIVTPLHLDCGIISSILKFADDTKLISTANNQEDSEETLSNIWQMAFNVDKCKVMHVGRTNIHSKYHMNDVQLGITKEEKDPGVIVVDDLMVAQHCAHAYSKANRTLGIIRRTIRSRDIGIMLSLYKTLVRPHLEYCSSSWSGLLIIKRINDSWRRSNTVSPE